MGEGGYEHLFDSIGLSRKIFRDETVLFPDFIPPYLPHRDAQMRQLIDYFRVVLESPGKVSQKVLCEGRVGVGKTAVAKLFSSLLEREANLRFGVKLKSVVVDCRKERTLFSVLQAVSSSLDPYAQIKGFSTRDIHKMILEGLEATGTSLLLVLDEVDYLLLSSGSDAIYELTRDEKGASRVSFMFISRSSAFMNSLDESTRSTLLHNRLSFPAYSSLELRDILTQRLPQAFVSGSVSDEVVGQAAELAASAGGDARLALELLWRAAKRAEEDGRDRVTPEDVRVVYGDIEGVPNEEELASLQPHMALSLLAIARALAASDRDRLTTGDAERSYAAVCEEYGVTPRAHTAFWEGLQELRDLGFISAEVRVEGKGRTTVIGMNYSASGVAKALESLIKSRWLPRICQAASLKRLGGCVRPQPS
ncbi:MAG: Cdc6/Cdc18 family protein [Thermoprotei archaeon]|nr:AAA family ATPase [TACK group archaeon]